MVKKSAGIDWVTWAARFAFIVSMGALGGLLVVALAVMLVATVATGGR